MIFTWLAGAPEAGALAEEAVRLTNWSDPEGYSTGGIILARLGSHEMALRALTQAIPVDRKTGCQWCSPARLQRPL